MAGSTPSFRFTNLSSSLSMAAVHCPQFDPLAEVGRAEDPELPGEVAAAWASSAERDPHEADPLVTLSEIVRVATAAEELGRGAYLWVQAV